MSPDEGAWENVSADDLAHVVKNYCEQLYRKEGKDEKCQFESSVEYDLDQDHTEDEEEQFQKLVSFNRKLEISDIRDVRLFFPEGDRDSDKGPVFNFKILTTELVFGYSEKNLEMILKKSV